VTPPRGSPRRSPRRAAGPPPWAEVADLALAMLRNAYLTNQVISLDGGMYPR
jgi:3-oxoacyl-[acyl-carrier protein] reductase